MKKIALHNLTWLAALIDGEGCVQVVCNRPSKNPNAVRKRKKSSFYFNINVTMCDREMIDRAHKITGAGSVLGPYKRKNPRHRDVIRWSVSSQEAAELAEQLLPYLLLKRKQAQFGIKLMKLSATVAALQSKIGVCGKLPRSAGIYKKQKNLYLQWKRAQLSHRFTQVKF